MVPPSALLTLRGFGTKPKTVNSGMKSLECQNLQLRINHRILLREVTFSLLPSQLAILTGANGIGKTTLLRCLAGIAAPHSGRVVFFEEELWPQRDVHREHRVCYLAAEPALLLDHSCASNLEFMANAFGYDPTFADLEKVTKRVNLEGRLSQNVRGFSTGQKRRLALAALLLVRPQVVLADEPTNGLDVAGKKLCLDIFSELKSQGCAFVVATHELDFFKADIELDATRFAPTGEVRT